MIFISSKQIFLLSLIAILMILGPLYRRFPTCRRNKYIILYLFLITYEKIQKKSFFSRVLYSRVQNSPDLPNRFLRLSQLKSLLNNFFKSQLLKSLRLPSYIRSIRYIASYTQPLSTSARSDRTRPFLLCVMTTYKNDCERPIYYILIQQYITSFSMLKIGFFI